VEFYIVQGLSLGLAVAIAPGPLQAYLLGQAVRYGPRHTLPLILAPVVSDVPIIALVLLTLAFLPDWALRSLQIGGGIVLMYLAWESYTHLRRPPVGAPDARQTGQSFLKAVLMNGLSPGPYIFWFTIAGPIFKTGFNADPWLGWAYLISFGVGLVIGLAAFVLTVGTTRHLNERSQMLINITTTVILAGFGVYQIWAGFFLPTSSALAH